MGKVNARLVHNLLNHKAATPEMADKAFSNTPDHETRDLIAGSKAFDKNLFNKYIDHPKLSYHMGASRHLNSWVDKVGMDKALSHPSEGVQSAAIYHPKFNEWVDKVGMDKALKHPSWQVRDVAAKKLKER